MVDGIGIENEDWEALQVASQVDYPIVLVNQFASGYRFIAMVETMDDAGELMMVGSRIYRQIMGKWRRVFLI